MKDKEEKHETLLTHQIIKPQRQKEKKIKI